MPETPDPTELQEISTSGLLDSRSYLKNNPDVLAAGLNALEHYCTFGWQEGRRPNPYFDGAWYLERNSDVRSAAMNPLLHYIRHGEQEGRRPVPIFEPTWYRAAYSVAPEQIALSHFLLYRYGARTLPSPELYFALHTSPFAELAAMGKDPFTAFAFLSPDVSPDVLEADAIHSSGLFDENYYLLNGSDLLDADFNLALHFCRWGWRERRKPNICFDTEWYLATNPDVTRLSINPLTHYLFEGEARGRRPIIYFDPLWYRETYAVSPSHNALAHYLQRRRWQTVSPNPFFDVSWYLEHHAEEIGPGRDAFAHYLHAGTYRDISPSPGFDAVAYRRRFLGKPSRLFRHLANPYKDNPLLHFLRHSYR